MALRPLDNALPIPTERPKKQAKVAALSKQKKPDSDAAVNDENKAPVEAAAQPPTGDASVEYISSQDLKPIVDPEIKIHGLVGCLESKDWLKVCEALNDARRFALFHSAFLQPILDKVMLAIVKATKNPRSAMCKTSIMAASDIFKTFGDKLLHSTTQANAFDKMLLQLLLKASQDKKFVCEEADRALKAMVDSMTPLPLLQKLRAYVSHTNMRVRAKAAVSISNCVSKMELEAMEEFGLAQLVQISAESLNDRLPEAREAARSTVVSVYEALTRDEEQKQETWQSFCQSNLQVVHSQAVIKLVSS